jgi:TolA-binding protein
MSRRLTRKQIKRDEVRESLDSVLDYLLAHRKTIGYGLLGLLAAGLAAVGVLSYLEDRESRAGEVLAQAMQVQRATIDPIAPQPEDPEAPTFADEAAREARAMELFEQIEREFGSSDAAAIASVYRAGLAARQGDYATARALWEEFVGQQENHALGAEVRLNLMALDRQQGRGEELAAEIRSMLESEPSPFPADVLLYELAKTLESLGDSEAGEVYRRLAEEHPESSFAVEARNRSDLPASGLGSVPRPSAAGS